MSLYLAALKVLCSQAISDRNIDIKQDFSAFGPFPRSPRGSVANLLCNRSRCDFALKKLGLREGVSLDTDYRCCCTSTCPLSEFRLHARLTHPTWIECQTIASPRAHYREERLVLEPPRRGLLEAEPPDLEVLRAGFRFAAAVERLRLVEPPFLAAPVLRLVDADFAR